MRNFNIQNNLLMKSILLTLLVVVFTLGSCQTKRPEGGFLLSGKIDGGDSTTYVLAKVQGRSLVGIDTSKVENGKVEFMGILEYPQQLYIVVEGQQRPVMQFFGENSDMVFEGNADSLHVAVVTGSEANDLMKSYNDSMKKYQEQNQQLMTRYQAAQATKDQAAIDAIIKEYEDMMAEKLVGTSEFITANPASPVSLFLIQAGFMREGYEKLNAEFSKLDTTLAVIPAYKEIGDYLKIVENVQVGQTAPDFTVPSIEEGKEITLSSLRGKYVLVDFWASWCQPCRAENPNVLAAYNKYKSKGFEVLSVSVDRDVAAWKKAVSDDGMIWLQGHDDKDISHSLYGVVSIPSTFLLDKDGVIINKNLRGGALEEKLQELLK